MTRDQKFYTRLSKRENDIPKVSISFLLISSVLNFQHIKTCMGAHCFPQKAPLVVSCTRSAYLNLWEHLWFCYCILMCSALYDRKTQRIMYVNSRTILFGPPKIPTLLECSDVTWAPYYWKCVKNFCEDSSAYRYNTRGKRQGRNRHLEI